MEKAEEAELQWRNNGDDEDDDVEEKVEDELDADLLQRKPRLLTQQTADNTATSPVGINGSSYNGGGVVVVNSELVNNGDESEEVKISTNGVKINDVDEMMNNGVGDQQKGSEYSVYYDKDQGIWKCRLCSWDFQCQSGLIDHIQCEKEHWHTLMGANTIDQQRPCFIHETKGVGFPFKYSEEQTRVESYASIIPEDDIIDVMLDSSERGNGLISAIKIQNEEHPKHEIVSPSSIQSSEISFEDLNNPSFKLSGNKVIEVPDIDLTEDGDNEETEFDVETVLKKQDTHDLFCPNCHSCITKRVILRKRKRRVRTAEEDAKRNKLESLTLSDLDVISEDLTSDRAPNEANLDENLPLALNDYNEDREPNIFRCFSCFSFFIPKSDGRSYFWMFSDSRKKETLLDSQSIPVVKKNWFSSIFASTKGTMLSEAGTSHRPDMNNIGAPRNPGDPKDQISSREGVPSHSAAGHGVDMPTTRIGSVDPSSQLDDPKSQVPSTQDAVGALGQYQADTLNELNSHIYSRETPRIDKSDSDTTSASKAPFTIGEDVESPIASPQQDDGLKFLIPSHVKPMVVEGLQKDLKVNLTAEKENADENTILLSSTPASNKNESYAVGIVNNSVNFPSGNGQHVTAARQSESVIVESENHKVQSKGSGYEVCLDHIVHQKLEIHLEKSPKSDKDEVISSIEDALLLQDGKNNLSKHPNPAETNAGKDTIITVEPAKVDTMPSRIQETTVVSSRDGPLPQINSALSAVVETGTIAREVHSLEIVKSIVYGGLIESIISVGVVSSAVGAQTATINVLALGLANLFGGLFVIANDLWDLKNEHSGDRYQVQLGRRENFLLHSIVAVFSYLIFGLLPPVLYGFSFRKSNDENFKLLVVAGSSILCISLLAAGKVYTQRPPKSYLKTLPYYISMGFMVSGAAYVTGNLINSFLEKFGTFPSSSAVSGLMEPTQGTLSLPGTGLRQPGWESY